MPLPTHLDCLHGFLGLPEDFDPLAAALARSLPHLALTATPLWPDASLPLEAWAAAHRRRARPGAALLGYSMGGRLALASFLHAASPHAALIVVAAHPGLSDPASRAARRAHDGAWAARFVADRWPDLLAAWDAQEVFGGRPQPLPRPERAFDRAALARALTSWSLAAQPDMRPALAAERRPILWLVGEHDARFRAVGAEAAALSAAVELVVIPGAGHRVPWEAPAATASAVAAFLASLPRP